MLAILRWLLTQATRGVLGQIIKSVLEDLGVWKFVIAVPIAVYVGVRAMAEGLQSVSVALMFVVAAAVVVLLHYVALCRERIREKYFGDTKPIILAELETAVPPIGDFTPACAIRVTNTGPELREKCLAQIEDHGLKMQMSDPFVIRTEGQIRDNRIGRFTLSAGQTKLIPILFRVPAHLGHFRFIGEDEKIYDFVGDSAEFVVAIYGADNPTKVRVCLDGGQDWKPNFEMGYC